LSLVASGEHKDVVQVILRNVDVDSGNNHGKTALVLALDWGHKEIAIYLLRRLSISPTPARSSYLTRYYDQYCATYGVGRLN